MEEGVVVSNPDSNRDSVDESSSIGCKQSHMFNRIAQTSAIIKSQQRGDKELALSEKVEHLNKLYLENKLTILRRFGKHLNLEDLELFNDSENYEMQFYVNKFRSLQDPVYKERVVKNRRYNYLKNILKDSDYFSDCELEKRSPFLYKQYIGQYASDEDVQSSRNDAQTFSQFLLAKIDKSVTDFRCGLEEDAILNVEEEEENEDSDNDIEDDEDFRKYLQGTIPMSGEERSRLREEFLCLMENSFIMGDENFDYSVIDNDEQYDTMCDQDIEDHYFDEEMSNGNENTYIDDRDLEEHYFDGDDDDAHE